MLVLTLIGYPFWSLVASVALTLSRVATWALSSGYTGPIIIPVTTRGDNNSNMETNSSLVLTIHAFNYTKN